MVIAYTARLSKAGLRSSSTTVVDVPVGWNEHQHMHVYVKQ